jgi:hypothetical protein
MRTFRSIPQAKSSTRVKMFKTVYIAEDPLTENLVGGAFTGLGWPVFYHLYATHGTYLANICD